jgi:hypothetical protein
LAATSQPTRTPQIGEQTFRAADLSWRARNGRMVDSGTRPSTSLGR